MAQVLTPSGRLPALKSPLQVSQTPDHQEEISDWSVLQGATDMVRAGIMDMVWEREKGGKSYKIGFLKQSPKLQQALNGGQLNQILQNLSDSYREVYGRAPWEEYLCCSNSECDGKMSLQDVFGDLDQGLSLREQEEGRFRTPSQYSCPKDGEDMEYFYDPEEHVETLINSFYENICATLLFEDDRKILGFCMGFETTVQDGWDDKVIVGKGDQARENLPYEEYLSEALELFGAGTQEQDKVLNVAEWGVLPEAQRQGAALALMRELYIHSLATLQDRPDQDIPVFAHTLDGSRAYQVTDRMGFQWGKVLPSGERRAYLTLKKAIQGIDKMMARKSLKIAPLHQQLEAEKQEIPRDTFVVEMLCQEAVGTDEDGNQKVHQYLAELSNMLGLNPVAASVTHLSPKYGLSGWMPLENGAAIHLYAWDHLGEEYPPFLSIDVSTPGVILNTNVLRAHAEQFFAAKAPSVHKNMQKKTQEHWKEIAPQILRQRISISGETSQELSAQQVKAYLKGLAPALNMVQLSEPLVVGQDAWIHWETSGVVLHWDKNRISVDIYTCKAFQEDHAVAFTSKTLGLSNTAYKSY